MSIDAAVLERYMQIAQDTKKVFHRSKASGRWYWCDRSEDSEEAALDGYTFPTFYECLQDAVTPYIEGEDT